MPDLSGFVPAFQLFVACAGAYLVALWLSLIIWTFRDMQGRTRDVISMALSTLLVGVFTFPGLLLYLILRPKETLSESYERSLEEEYCCRTSRTPRSAPPASGGWSAISCLPPLPHQVAPRM